MTQALYRFYNENDELLYVGVTMNPPQRFRSHASTKEWWREVDHITLANHETRGEVLAAEREAIRGERPLYNVAMNGSAFTCHVCQRPIHEDLDDDEAPDRHAACDDAFTYAHQAGWQAGKEWTYDKTLGERIGHKLVSAHCDGISHAGVDHYRYRKAGW